MIGVVVTHQVEAGVVAAALMGGTRTDFEVFAVFERACYARDTQDRVLVLTDARASRGPLHIVLENLPSLKPGDRLSVGERQALLPQAALVHATTWRGATPALSQTYPLAARLFRELTAPHPFVEPFGDGAEQPHLPSVLARRDPVALARQVGGRGPGLTPTGDDVLAGALFVARLRGHPARELEGAVLPARSNTIATAFLRAATDGHCIEPAHDLVHAIHVDAEEDARAACARLGRYGASSGAALTYGILGSLA